MKKSLAIAIVPFVLAGCISVPSKAPSTPAPVEKPSEIVQSSLDIAGTYNAKLACESCDYKMARLQLNQYGQYRYLEQDVKNGVLVGNPVVFQGKYTWDTNAPIIRLLNARNMHFFVAENQVVMLSQPVTKYSELTNEPRFEKVVRNI